METIYLIEKCALDTRPTILRIVGKDTGSLVQSYLRLDGMLNFVSIGLLGNVTKRGWTYNASFLCHKTISVFVDRSHFTVTDKIADVNLAINAYENA